MNGRKLSKTTKLATATAVLAPMLMAGLATPAHAADQVLYKDGCWVTLRPPKDTKLSSGSQRKLIDYKVKVTCNPGNTIEFHQTVWEDDSGLFDGDDRIRGRKYVQHKFTQSSGKATWYSHYRVYLPDTESGREEMYHEAQFHVKAGSLNGGWTDWHSSHNTSFAN